MVFRSTTRLIGVAALSAGLLCAIITPQAISKTTSTAKKSTKAHSVHGKKLAHRGKHHLVPPPPPYAPSILPEIAYAKSKGISLQQKETEPPNPWSKYVYTRAGYEIKAKKPNQYVTVWTN
ncbi:MAG: hypothetical protein K2Z81_07110 [Cyanobacteria bacterium]|nr:hypothetical protein [Cyanobacteriota bacterium]